MDTKANDDGGWVELAERHLLPILDPAVELDWDAMDRVVKEHALVPGFLEAEVALLMARERVAKHTPSETAEIVLALFKKRFGKPKDGPGLRAFIEKWAREQLPVPTGRADAPRIRQ